MGSGKGADRQGIAFLKTQFHAGGGAAVQGRGFGRLHQVSGNLDEKRYDRKGWKRWPQTGKDQFKTVKRLAIKQDAVHTQSGETKMKKPTRTNEN